MNWAAFSADLSHAMGDNIEIHNADSVGGGDIHQAYRLDTSSGELFLKLNQVTALPLFTSEAHSLNAIHQTQTIRCPNVIGYGENGQHAWLLMEYLPLTHRGDDAQRGRDLALMHQQIHSAPQPFGWFEDNYIGHSIQRNQWHADWVGFYGQERLQPQLELAQLNGASSQLFETGQQLIQALPFWFEDYQPAASLLHGDLWGGNSAFLNAVNGNASQAVIYDPASYYGDRETDIAMTELFGGFSAAFYTGYHEVFPLDRGYSQRKPLYNLYHLLNHFNLFGGHYQHQAQHSINALLAQAQ